MQTDGFVTSPIFNVVVSLPFDANQIRHLFTRRMVFILLVLNSTTRMVCTDWLYFPYKDILPITCQWRRGRKIFQSFCTLLLGSNYSPRRKYFHWKIGGDSICKHSTPSGEFKDTQTFHIFILFVVDNLRDCQLTLSKITYFRNSIYFQQHIWLLIRTFFLSPIFKHNLFSSN